MPSKHDGENVMYILGAKIDMTEDGWSTIVMEKLDDALARNAPMDLSIMAYAILLQLKQATNTNPPVVDLAKYRAEYMTKNEATDPDDDITEPWSPAITDLLNP